MYTDWLRANGFDNLPDPGNDEATIKAFAELFDTNDQKSGQNEDTRMHLGSSSADTFNGLRAYINQPTAYSRSRVIRAAFNVKSYRNTLDRHRQPAILYYNNTDGCTGHVVVTTGYDANQAAIKVQDPFDGTNKLKPVNQISGGFGIAIDPRYGNPLTVPFDSDWDDAFLDMISLSDYGDAPSEYLQTDQFAASHESIFREFLGESVSFELDAFGQTDFDGIANVGNNDQRDDGFRLTDWNPGGLSTGIVSVTHDLDCVIATGLDPKLAVDPILNIGAWADWDDDRFWDAQQEELFSFSIAADFDGTQQIDVSFQTPVGADPTWMRLRLARGEEVTPYGSLLFGEVEDFVLIPEPSALLSIVLAMSAVLMRRRSGSYFRQSAEM